MTNQIPSYPEIHEIHESGAKGRLTTMCSGSRFRSWFPPTRPFHTFLSPARHTSSLSTAPGWLSSASSLIRDGDGEEGQDGIGGAVFQSTFTRADPSPLKDWTDSGWAGPFVLYIMYGMADAAFQCYCYWSVKLVNDLLSPAGSCRPPSRRS